MPSLIRTLRGPEIASCLEAGFRALSKAYLYRDGLRKRELPMDREAVEKIDDLLDTLDEEIDLRGTQKVCRDVEMERVRPSELFNNLRHIFVLLQAEKILKKELKLKSVSCAPTQQSTEAGEDLADLQGKGWVLEAYGGACYTNNAKLALDLRTLHELADRKDRCFLAARSRAIPRSLKKSIETKDTFRTSCPKKKGGPFSITATISRVGETSGVVVLEAKQIGIDSKPDAR